MSLSPSGERGGQVHFRAVAGSRRRASSPSDGRGSRAPLPGGGRPTASSFAGRQAADRRPSPALRRAVRYASFSSCADGQPPHATPALRPVSFAASVPDGFSGPCGPLPRPARQKSPAAPKEAAGPCSFRCQAMWLKGAIRPWACRTGSRCCRKRRSTSPACSEDR